MNDSMRVMVEPRVRWFGHA